MKPVIFPLKLDDFGPNVANLQAALLLLIDRGAIQVSAQERDEFNRILRLEQRDQVYKDATFNAVALFQKQHRLESSGAVDERTARALNLALEDLGALPKTGQDLRRLVSGQVQLANGEAFQDGRVRAFHQAGDPQEDGAGAIRLGEDATDGEGRYTIRYDALPGIDGVNLRVTVLDGGGRLLKQSELIRAAKPVEMVNLIVTAAEEPAAYRVEGTVASRVSAGVGGLLVHIVDKGVGGDTALTEAVTDENGAFQASFTDAEIRRRGKERPDLQARVISGETFLGASEVRYNASQQETLNILLNGKTAAALRSEYEALTGSLSSHFKGKLGDLQETDARQDITHLANKTGWDARLVALTALGDQFSAGTKDASGAPTLAPPFFYALFRAGLPTNEAALYQIDAKTAEAAWKQAIAQGIIPAALESSLPAAVEAFQKLVARQALDSPPAIGLSPLKDLLAVSLGVDPNPQSQKAKEEKLADLLTRHRDDPDTLKLKLRENFGEAAERRLSLDGKLAFQNLNNAKLIKKLHDESPGGQLRDPIELAQQGYYKPQKWKEAIAGLPIPPEIPGKDDAEKQVNYAEFLAQQVRLSFPTAVVAQMLLAGETQLRDKEGKVIPKETVEDISGFLIQHQGKFELGVQPVKQYVRQNNVQISAEVSKEIIRIQRVYQITPGDGAMNALLDQNVDSAYKVVRRSEAEFTRDFKDNVGGEATAGLIYRRAEEVHNTTLQIAVRFLMDSRATGIGLNGKAHFINPASAGSLGSDVIALPTLESLFGGMDFCACEHCRSMLSPAAYMVDLLHFLDRDDDVWATFLTNWNADHEAPYPFASKAEWEKAGKPAGVVITPLQVLLSRRPDLQHLPLTCENTNTPLPYIDLVNETLEHFVASGSLADYTGHTTDGSASTEELLANPQFVADQAYTILAEANFPPPLPFHRPLEAMRRYFDRFEAPLHEVMEALRTNDDLERASDDGYGWRDILMETLRLSRAEYKLLTDAKLELPGLYGYPKGNTTDEVRAELSNARAFARRMDISYDELVRILETRFVNPASALLPRLERLGVSFDTLKKFKEGKITPEQFKEALAPQLDVSQYGGDILAWVRDKANAKNFKTIMGLITLTNPVARLIRILLAAGVPLDRLKALKAGAITDAEFEAGLPATLNRSKFGGNVAQWVRDNFTVAALSDDSRFEAMEFHYADPDRIAQRLSAIDFMLLARFIRLWKKLGWTIEYIDMVITALYPANQIPGESDDEATILQKLEAGFLTLLPRVGALRQVMKALKSKPQDLPSLLALFAPIDAHGENSLYHRMFLSSSLAEQDPAFADDGYGNVLEKISVAYTHPKTKLEPPILEAAANKISYNHGLRRLSYSGALDAATRDKLKSVAGATTAFQDAVEALYATGRLAAHAEALRAAFALTGEELDLITASLDFNADTPLTLEKISAIFRHGWLARKLKLSVREFLLLTEFTGLDPFAAPAPPDPPILRLIELLDHLRRASLKPAQALYLVWNQDVSGKSTPEEAEILDFARLLRASLATIVSEFALAADPDGQIARARMTLVYGSEATDLFFGLLNLSFTSEVLYDHTKTALEDSILNAGPGRIAYDDFLKRLSFRGVMTEAARDALLALPGTPAEFPTAVQKLFGENQKVIGPFFARYPELLKLHDDFFASGQPNQSDEEKRTALLKSFLPELVRRRKLQQAVQAIGAAAGTDVEFARAVLDAKPEFTATLFNPKPERVYVLHSNRNSDRPALDDLAAAEKAGLSVQFFFRDTASGNVDDSREAEANLAYAPGSNPLPKNTSASGSPISGIWSGYLEAPEDDFYNFLIETDPSADVTLTMNGALVALAQDNSNQEPIELRAGTLYRFELRVEKVKDVLSVRWETRGRGREIIPARFLYPDAGIDALTQVYVRFLKAASLAKRLNADEFAYLAAHPNERITGQGWLNHLPVTGSPDQQLSKALLQALQSLLDFARFKAVFGSEDDLLLSVLQDPGAAAQSLDGPLFSLTRWEPASLDALLKRFGNERKHLANLIVFRQVYEAMAWVKRMGVPAAALIAAATNEPDAGDVQNLQSALRARFNDGDWLKILKPINDELRALQRDALVAHILQGMRLDPATAHIDTPEKLFEFFLMDVQMEPCMQTSRVRHALSSIQLFIERILMNLEPRVSPVVIPAEQWEWMSRYRVWEANRKVFLFPENWLEPELRDDQSPFFKETMSELLQSDITQDSAEIALLNYLGKLDEVAKLEPCGIYYEEDNLETEVRDEVVHVVARTAGANRKYFYRCLKYGSWTPWEQIRLDIEDNPVIPVVWRDRLLIFWLRILQTPFQKLPTLPDDKLIHINANNLLPDDSPQVNVQAVLCWSEYYNGKWQPTRTSDLNSPVLLGIFDSIGERAFNRSALRLETFESLNPGAGTALTVRVSGQGGARFTLYNTHSLPVSLSGFGAIEDPVLQDPTKAISLRLVSTPGRQTRNLETKGDEFSITYIQESGLVSSNISPPHVFSRPVLRNRFFDNSDRAVEPRHDGLRNPWDAPFLYGDSRHEFLVTTARRQVLFPDWGGYTTPPLKDGTLQLPPLVQPALPVPERAVLIRRELGTSDTVLIGKIKIGPRGGLRNGDRKE